MVANNVQNPQANIAQFGSAANPLTLTGYAGFTQLNPMPAVMQWNFGVQQEVARGTMVEVNYVGNHGVHQPVSLPANTIPYDPAIDSAVALANTTLAMQQARPFPAIASFSSINMEGTSTRMRRATGEASPPPRGLRADAGGELYAVEGAR